MDNNPKQRAWPGHQDEPAQAHFKLLSGALRCSHLNCFLVELSSLLFNANLIPFLWTATLPPPLPTPLPLKLPEPFFTLSLKATTINKTREAAGISGEGWGHSVALWEHRWALFKSNSLFHALTSLCCYPHLRQYFCFYCCAAPRNVKLFKRLTSVQPYLDSFSPDMQRGAGAGSECKGRNGFLRQQHWACFHLWHRWPHFIPGDGFAWKCTFLFWRCWSKKILKL